MHSSTLGLLVMGLAVLSNAAKDQNKIPDCSKFLADNKFAPEDNPDVQIFTVDAKNPGWEISFQWENLKPEIQAMNPHKNDPDQQFSMWNWFDNTVFFANLANGTVVHACSTAYDSKQVFNTQCVRLHAGEYCEAKQMVKGSPKRSFQLKTEITTLEA